MKPDRRIADDIQVAHERRKPRNIINENNHEDQCIIEAAGSCTCGSLEDYYGDLATFISDHPELVEKT